MFWGEGLAGGGWEVKMGIRKHIQLTAYEKKQVEGVKEYVDHHLHQDLHAGELALEWDISGYKLRAGFVQLFGKTFPRYLKEGRMERARELLHMTNKIIYEIARDCGYKDETGFHKAFRKWYGQTPDVFRKS